MSEINCPVVGVGASAGGVQALEALFSALPSDTGLSFVVITHIARGHESALPEIIGRQTSMTVVSAENDGLLEPNHVYICPSAHVLTVRAGRLELHKRVSDQQRKPIDVFLGSLAESHGESAIGVILSGSGTDGTMGIKAVKERGGLTFAQGPDGSAPQYSEMPESAIATGVIDLVLPTEQIAARLAEFARDLRSQQGPGARTEESNPGAEIERFAPIFPILLNRVGHDFSGYKKNTFVRRVRRRMQILQIENLEEYIKQLNEHPDEATLLFRDLLIGVTNFFRDEQAFEKLNELVVPKIFEGKGANDILRIWVPGCSTGEEVYSLAILMREHIDTLRAIPKVQLFATDIDEHALSVARAARYPVSLLENVSPQRLKRFFSGDGVSYVVNKEIRDLCIFSSQNVIRDPPFSRIDLISCRNLLIYLGAAFQAQVIPVFHFALRPRGYLFLGTSENVSQYVNLFSPIDKRQRIFQRRDNVHVPLQFPFSRPWRRPGQDSTDAQRESGQLTVNLRRLVENRILERFAPPHVVVNLEGDILHYSARTGKYLEPAAGLPNRQLLAMARPGLRLELRAALREAMENRRTASREQISVEIDDRVQRVNVTVEPFGDSDADPLFLVLFTDVGQPLSGSQLDRHTPENGHAEERLEHELHETRERLQSTIEEYEGAVEELKSSNEELQSINEELQSSNEELETSKEELQSVNEELHTVNAELNGKVEELDRANSDIRNLFESTQIATVFLDKDLVVRSFTPAVTQIFNLISSDRGRPLTDIVNHIDGEDLPRELRAVLENGSTIEREVRHKCGRVHYLMRILPYSRVNNSNEGVLVTFVDITKIVEAEAHQRVLVEELNHRVRNMLTIVSAIASQTMARSPTKEAFAEAFIGRIRAMSTAYTLVSKENWGDVPLREIVVTHLEPYRIGSNDSIKIEGPEVFCKPNAALGFGMVVHELATNALKYGSLSSPQGQVTVTWAIERQSPEVLTLIWREKGGPAVERPKKRGFGTELIERELLHTLGAEVNFHYREDGLRVVITVPPHPGRWTVPA